VAVARADTEWMSRWKRALERHRVLVAAVRAARLPYHSLREELRRARLALRRRPLIRRQLRAGIRNLQLGCGETPLDGWLNTDARPLGPAIAYLDVSERFPFPDATFDGVYSEHLIEHLSYEDGGAMLAECHRVLRPGGILRTATPDLSALVGLCTADKDELQERYLRRFIDRMDLPKIYRGSVVLNTFLRSWGHRFVYDAETLAEQLALAGFTDVVRCPVGESAHAALRKIERHDLVIGEEMNRFETMVLEARRP
jgi:predicted SAM-dependent methyltransferase